MKYKISYKVSEVNFLSNILFFAGIFFIPSAIAISIFCLFTAFFISTIRNYKNLIHDRWNWPLILSSLLILISSIFHSINYSEIKDNWEPSLSWIGLSNWIPLFWCYWSAQNFLKDEKTRQRCAVLLIAGSLPVLVTGIGQYFFNWTGPIEGFFGLIKWYQKPIIDPAGLSGLFSNPNYAGAWLNIVWPFTIAAIYQKNKFIKKTTICSFILGVFICIILTNSRAAWGGLFLGIVIVTGIRILKLLLPISVVMGTLIFSCIKPIFGNNFQIFIRSFIPEKFWMEFTTQGFEGLDTSRINIWNSAIQYILDNPIFGTGASSFTSNFFNETGFYKGHAHNLFLELAVSYGLPATILISLFIIYLVSSKLYKSQIFYNSRNIKNIYFERAWIAAFFTLIILNMVDVQYFDVRISITFWILLAGIRNMKNDQRLNT